MSEHVLYLTGAPASGKSTLSATLRERLPNLAVFEYGAQLTAYLSKKRAGLQQEELRRRSADIASRADIEAVDKMLLTFAAKERLSTPVVIDSHAVTKESYGFRVTPYSLVGFQRLKPTMIVMLYTDPAITLQRIKADPAGRPMITNWEAGLHTGLQASVAVTYSIAVGVPLYLFDAALSVQELATEIHGLLAKPVLNEINQTIDDRYV
ncbi:MAG TPA: ATP-binding protein [Gemmatimonadaceae bacterium]|jgi:adenylate kinase